MNFFIEANNFEMWDFFTNGPFIPTYCINSKVLNKLDNVSTEDDKIKVKLDFKTKYLFNNTLSTKELFSVLNYNYVREV